MKSNLLQSKINDIQSEYKELLSALLPRLQSPYAATALDEINLFWTRYIETVQLYLRYYFRGNDSYVFTASTFMDYDDNEHLPFLLVGGKHILDDPLSKYSVICNNMPAGRDAETLQKQIGLTAADNIKIIENCKEIIILPLRLLNQSSTYTDLFELGERFFVHMFKGIESVADFFAKCTTIDDILKYARKDIGGLIKFSENDDQSLAFKERFERALAETEYMIDLTKPDSYNFFTLVFGCIQQAVDVIVSCIEYGCVPYIRYPVSLHYISLLSESFLDIEHIRTVRYKMSVAFVVYQLCDKSQLSKVGTNTFERKNLSYCFSRRLFSKLEELGITEDNFIKHRITEIVIAMLEEFYDYLESSQEVDSKTN